ncbi:hypothetical protein LZQ00_06090 [Sphingobacterium sp. SRCM116780]|uniref:hypothetical protein n=1 Tax=Sphingobacterium sp. SRCM116780 TaxID=2907623 RepID=UPI001F39467C|nr:hypothetical protein [Sphingobacterium sp. SRCM116780]UIR57385.1 hypothetical protein LZQ00_06090 [Sphingobacterium sp. SRCM116780]
METSTLYFIADQPANCPLCGANTECMTTFLNSRFVQIHTCQDVHCSYGFSLNG